MVAEDVIDFDNGIFVVNAKYSKKKAIQLFSRRLDEDIVDVEPMYSIYDDLKTSYIKHVHFIQKEALEWCDEEDYLYILDDDFKGHSKATKVWYIDLS